MSRVGTGVVSDRGVQGTGGSSAVSKCSAAARGYIQDRFLRLLAGRQRRRAPLIHRGYYVRARAVDHCVQDFLLKTQSHPRTQVLSLGAGFDSLYFRLKDMGLLHHTVVCEVDFPNVVCQKATLIKRMEELSALVGDTAGEGLGAITFSGEDYKLLGVDLSDLSELGRALEEAGLDNEIPTLFIAEVVLTYMENSRSDALIQWAAERFPRACFLLYEQVHPEDPFGRVMQQHFSQLNSALHSLAQYPDCEAQQRRFLGRGWTECSVMDMNEFFTCCIPEEEQQRVQALEPFDEYEEWHLKCSHYFVLTASKGMEPSWTPLLPSVTVPHRAAPVGMAGSVPAAVCARLSGIPGLRRYGHRSVLIKPDVILTTGGFGEEDGQHCRLRNFHVLSKHAGCWKAGCVTKKHPDKRWGGRLYHTVSCLSDTLALVVGGRMSPSSAGLGMLWLKFPETYNASAPDDIAVEPVNLQPAAEPATLRWRHSTTEVTFKGEQYLFVYGGHSALEPVLGDWYFLHTRELSSTVIAVEGPVPESRHSHSACSWEGGVLIAGGLGAAEQPLGSVFLLRKLEHGFQWQAVETSPPLIPRYSHTAHVHEGKLLLVGGVWLHESSVPGITVLDLMTGLCLDYVINVEHLEWPLMLHNHSSVFLPDEKELLVIGGGGNCFSFGTHLNPEPVSLSLSSILTSH
ncbi:tRNA wybutosine-synthesizing protein 4 isoform X2 [Neopelma chrysocephalum]|uniref:tRNA wybutosine-synthesizing protein 4 isoform X2 n=1 Tax=Neopelma chrysocephalum TaxID=114329 RepID=UPI000FCD3E40|nr:tRNA wybutosine-synthesizing protein 4 isoform X2 [Neopelma chrysocephalum]